MKLSDPSDQELLGVGDGYKGEARSMYNFATLKCLFKKPKWTVFSPTAINKNLLIFHTDLTNPIVESYAEKRIISHLVTNKSEGKMKNLASTFNSPTFIIFTNLFILLFINLNASARFL